MRTRAAPVALEIGPDCSEMATVEWAEARKYLVTDMLVECSDCRSTFSIATAGRYVATARGSDMVVSCDAASRDDISVRARAEMVTNNKRARSRQAFKKSQNEGKHERSWSAVNSLIDIDPGKVGS